MWGVPTVMSSMCLYATGAADSILASWMVLGKMSSEDVSATAETNGPAKHVQGAPTMTGSQAATAAAEDGCALLQ